jgi:hypothetical protein
MCSFGSNYGMMCNFILKIPPLDIIKMTQGQKGMASQLGLTTPCSNLAKHGYTGSREWNAPFLNLSSAFPFVVVHSGNIVIG